MSGPKLSEAEIERLRQEQLERERQATLKRLMDVRNKYKMACGEVELLKSNALNLLMSIDSLYRSNAEKELQVVLRDMECNSIISSNPEDYILAVQRINGMINFWKDRISEILKPGLIRAENDEDISNRNNDFQVFSSNKLIKNAEIEPVRIDFSCHFDDIQSKKILFNMYNHYEKRIKNSMEPRLQLFDKKALLTIKQMMDSNSSLEAVRNELQQIINEEENQIRLIKEFDVLYNEYVALSLLLSTKSKEKEDMEIDSLKNELENLKDEYKRRDEMDFIADQINEVMIEMGYSFVSSRVLTKKDNGETEYSLYQEEEHSGVAVYTDESGAVMMRMTILGDSCEITEADRELSYQSQIDFCSRHSDLVNALAERGVYLKQRSYQAPNRQHTYKVSMSDQMAASSLAKSKVTSKTQKVDRRARRRGENKKVRTM